jgi:hypothetical protein
MNRAYQFFVFEFRGAVPLVATVILGFFLLLFTATDITRTGLDVEGFENPLQLIGMLALFVLLPLWMISCFIVTQRHTLKLASQLEQFLPAGSNLVSSVKQFPLRNVLLGLGAGVIYALVFNVPSSQYEGLLQGNAAVTTIFLGQVLVWASIGFLLGIRLHVVGAFHQAGEVLEFSLFEQSNLSPFARVGMLDVVIIVGGMAVATVQSLDAQFRVENYLTALLVAVPAGAALLLRPMWSLHRRLRERKLELLEDVNARIAGLPEKGDDQDMQVLESLLQRRDRVQALPTLPLDIGVWSRLAVYILIPPLAWAGAALMEVMVSTWLGV